MGKIKNAQSAAVSGSEARRRGRKLALKFAGDELPALARIEFRLNAEADEDFLENGHSVRDKGFEWDRVAQAFALLFLQYLVWDKNGRQGTFYFSGKCRNSLAASLGDAIYKDNAFQVLFSDPTAPPKNQKLMLRIFCGENLAGRSTKGLDRHISVSEHFLPPDCVEVFWKERGEAALAKTEDLGKR